MHSYRTDKDDRIRQHLSFAVYITQYWQEQGWLEEYGKEYTQWLLEFIIADCRVGEVLCEDEHAKTLYKLLKDFSLEKYLDNVSKESTFLANIVKKAAA